MMLQKYNPRRGLPSLFDNTSFDSMFSTMLDHFLYGPEHAEDNLFRGPTLYSHTHDNEYIVCADLPGYDTDNIKVEVTDDTVKVEGKLEDKDKNGSRTASFRKEFTIPSDVDREQIKAKLEKGVLEVILPRKQKEARIIEIE